ncbi:MAG: DNA mismatch repair protein MutS [Crocinitomicaceae bacterium]|nr:DNA mismatch repair protein MutS [Crocinitomicaceae bacterium]MBP6032692.1 DNA mismatch repair protein MutS [Crocinitomicaceae bacterium]
MHTTDSQTLNDLEFELIREWLESFCVGPSAKLRAQKLTPGNRFKQIRMDLNRLNEFKSIRIHGEKFPALDFEELETEIRLLGIQQAVIPIEGFRRLYQASDLVNHLIQFFDKALFQYPLLKELTNDVYFTKEILTEIDKVFDRSGNVKDDASPELKEIRGRIKTLRVQINRNFDRELRKYNKDKVLGETLEGFINDRRVLTVQSTFKRKVPGNIHGSSKTGSLTFVEPVINVPLNNELEFLFDDERKEIHRILQVLTSTIAHFKPLIEAYQVLLVQLDFINAKCKLALDLNANLPAIGQSTGFEIKDAFHPILWKSNQASGKPTFPQTVSMSPSSRLLVISGPNAGGKSITLKTVGLLQMMLQAGLLVPVQENSIMCFFSTILSDIGDNQSIENELSTYSYRLQRMKYFLEVANHQSLLLLDEFGTGSDPELGGALGEVFFEQIYQLKSFGVITTHYGNIKLKASELPHAQNGCMLFNEKNLQPLYQFSIGQPGSSFTFEVAQMNGISKELIEDAKSRLDQKKVKLDTLLNSLQKERNQLLEKSRKFDRVSTEAIRAKAEYESKESKLDSRLTQVNQVTEVNSKQLQAGKKMLQFIERFNAKSRKKDVNTVLFQELTQFLRMEKSKTEIKKQETVAPKKPTKKQQEKVETYQQELIEVGCQVQLIQTNRIGIVEEMKGKQLSVIFGQARIKVSLDKLRFLKK